MINSKKILIVGGSGLLGRYLLMTAPAGNHIAATWCRNYQEGIDWHMDITQPESMHYVFDLVRPDYVILCSAIGSVDYCEKHYQEAWAVNVTGVHNIISACNDYNSIPVFISSNAVFRGDAAPYAEGDLLLPVNRYGRMKLAAEDAVAKMLRHYIIRPIMLFGWPFHGGRGNWATFVVESLRAGKLVHAVDDVITQPTYAHSCASAIWQLLEHDFGTWHVAGDETMSLWEFARMIAHVWGFDRELVKAIKSDDPMLKDIAPRPANPTYCLEKLHSAGISLAAHAVGELRRMWNE